jgi:hypothetical protein
MFRIAKNAMAAIALAGLVVAQPAMAVRSSDSLPAPGAKVSGVASRVGTPVGQSEQLHGIPTFGWLIALLIAAGALIIILDDNKNHHHSPG